MDERLNILCELMPAGYQPHLSRYFAIQLLPSNLPGRDLIAMWANEVKSSSGRKEHSGA